MKGVLPTILSWFGKRKEKVDVRDGFPDIREDEFWEIYSKCQGYTMTSVERMYSLYCAVNYVLAHQIRGDFVECGVWRGGSAMLIASMLVKRNILDRKIYLYDTYEGMSEPTDLDAAFSGEKSKDLLKQNEKSGENLIWCIADLEDVMRNLKTTELPVAQLEFVKGKVEDTLPQQRPASDIALLRLDTDWYESTRHELNVLFPQLVKHGILIIDDYGHWQGCRKAVDDYFEANRFAMLFNRVDYTGRIAIKLDT